MYGTGTSAAVEPVLCPRHRWNPGLSFGPGLLFALAMLGPSSLVENVTAGASRGYGLLWVLAVILAFRFVWLNLSAKYVLVTGETLLRGYGRYGRWIPWLVFASLLIQRHLSNLSKIVLMGAAADLLMPLPLRASPTVWSLLFSAAALVLMTRQVRALERWFRPVIVAMGAALFVAAALSHPHFPGILHGLFVPSLSGRTGPYSSLLMITALVGTEAGALTNLSYSYFMLQKGWRDVSCLGRQRFDLLCSVGSIFLVDALLQIAAAGTLWPVKLVPANAEHLVAVFSSTLGITGRIIFAFGLWAVCFSGLVTGTTGCALSGSDIWKTFGPRRRVAAIEPGVADPDAGARTVRLWLVSFWTISPLYALFLRVRPISLVLAASSLTALLMPALGIALLLLMNDRRRLGAYRNGPVANLALGTLVLASLYLSVRNAFELLQH
ncbi:MAG TPA: Nramp family divalent metal transporter [Bryobacteraceae bacterium]|nr:Nramp family divalent metal transporter [Bryobacteraceae bacterium]